MARTVAVKEVAVVEMVFNCVLTTPVEIVSVDAESVTVIVVTDVEVLFLMLSITSLGGRLRFDSRWARSDGLRHEGGAICRGRCWRGKLLCGSHCTQTIIRTTGRSGSSIEQHRCR